MSALITLGWLALLIVAMALFLRFARAGGMTAGNAALLLGGLVVFSGALAWLSKV